MTADDSDLGELLDEVGATAGRAKAKAVGLTTGARTTMVKRIPRRRHKPIDLSSHPAEAKLLSCRILTRQAKSERLLDPREISNLYLFASTIGLDAESRTVLRREITAAPADANDADGDGDDALALAARLSDLLDEQVHTITDAAGPSPAGPCPYRDAATNRQRAEGRGQPGLLENTVAQSVLMLTTVHPSVRASSSACSAPLV